MIYLTKGQNLFDNPSMVVYDQTGYYNDGDPVVCASAENMDEPVCRYEAKFVAYGSNVYSISDTEKLTEEILKNDPSSLFGKDSQMVAEEKMIEKIETVDTTKPPEETIDPEPEPEEVLPEPEVIVEPEPVPEVVIPEPIPEVIVPEPVPAPMPEPAPLPPVVDVLPGVLPAEVIPEAITDPSAPSAVDQTVRLFKRKAKRIIS